MKVIWFTIKTAFILTMLAFISFIVISTINNKPKYKSVTKFESVQECNNFLRAYRAKLGYQQTARTEHEGYPDGGYIRINCTTAWFYSPTLTVQTPDQRKAEKAERDALADIGAQQRVAAEAAALRKYGF